jgi:hypothetical protein
MNGTVMLESRPGRTVATLDLPATAAPSRDADGSFSRENEGEPVQPAS